MGEHAVPVLPSRDLRETLVQLLRLRRRRREPAPLLERRGGGGPTDGQSADASWDTDYGMVEFAVVDRSGNPLRFGSSRLDR